MGDFNETMYGEEHFSVHPRPAGQMQAFREVIDFCSFQDLRWIGVPFTWDNRQQGTSNVKAHLDRALANNDFMQLFEHTSVNHINSTTSDHCYVLAELRTIEPNRWPASRRPFRYENIWQSHSQYDQLVMDSWQTGVGQNGLEGVMVALTSIQQTLGSWGDREFGNMARKFENYRKILSICGCNRLAEGHQLKNFQSQLSSKRHCDKRTFGSNNSPGSHTFEPAIGTLSFSMPVLRNVVE